MLKLIFICLICLASVNSQTNWASRACLVGHNDYFVGIMQKVINRLETEVKWCNFKLLDVNQEIDLSLFDLHVKGTVNYTNGYLTDFDKVDVSTIVSQFESTTVNGTTQGLSSINGLLNFRLFHVGYDVTANLENLGIHHFTAILPYSILSLRCTIVENVTTKEITVSTVASSTPTGRRMLYVPDNKISDVLSRNFAITLPGGSFTAWGTDHVEPILKEVATEAVLPEIRFDYTC